MPKIVAASLGAIALFMAAPLASAKPPDTWDGLHRVQVKGRATVYLAPNADFRTYSKVQIASPEVAFSKDWQRNLRGLDRLNDREVQQVRQTASTFLSESLAKAFSKAGYQVVSDAGPDVLLVRTGLVNLQFVVPQQSARSFTISEDAGEATLFLEVRDSIGGSLLGRALDTEVAGGGMPVIRNESSLRADFEYLFADWARRIAGGMDKLKANSPIDTNGRRAR
ncbi:MAG TPA: DUF3313 family protein [Sphingomicrobium sp.]|nr:DUF3313 family protein [Sphingomicrobium sp.]